MSRDAGGAVATGRRVTGTLRGNEFCERHRRPVTVTNRRFLPARYESAPVPRLRAGRVAGRARVADTAQARAADTARARLSCVLRWRARPKPRQAMAGRDAS